MEVARSKLSIIVDVHPMQLIWTIHSLVAAKMSIVRVVLRMLAQSGDVQSKDVKASVDDHRRGEKQIEKERPQAPISSPATEIIEQLLESTRDERA